MARSPARSKDMSETETPLPPEPDSTETRVQEIDLDSLSGHELMSLIEQAMDHLDLEGLLHVTREAESRRHTKQAEAREILLIEFRERAEKMGMSLDTLFPHLNKPGGTRRSRSDAGQPLAPKFQGPNGETWSGRGIPPRWLSALIAEGHSREDYRIKTEEENGEKE